MMESEFRKEIGRGDARFMRTRERPGWELGTKTF
jgi:hypothetical protein